MGSHCPYTEGARRENLITIVQNKPGIIDEKQNTARITVKQEDYGENEHFISLPSEFLVVFSIG